MAWCKTVIDVVYEGGESEYKSIQAPVLGNTLPVNVVRDAVAEIEATGGRRVLFISCGRCSQDRDGAVLTGNQCREMIKNSRLTSIFTDSEPSNIPPVCGDLEHCECGMCATAYAEYLASDSPAGCARCGGCGRIEVDTIAGRMLDTCPDCTQSNDFF